MCMWSHFIWHFTLLINFVTFLFTGLWQGMEDFQSWGTWIYQAVCKWQLKDFWTWFLFVLLWITHSFSTVIILMRVHTLTQPVDVKICSAKTVSVVVLVNEGCTLSCKTSPSVLVHKCIYKVNGKWVFETVAILSVMQHFSWVHFSCVLPFYFLCFFEIWLCTWLGACTSVGFSSCHFMSSL